MGPSMVVVLKPVGDHATGVLQRFAVVRVKTACLYRGLREARRVPVGPVAISVEKELPLGIIGTSELLAGFPSRTFTRNQID